MLSLAIALAAGLGAVTRYLVDQLVQYRSRGDFPYGTVIINVTGSLVLGVATGLALHRWQLEKTVAVIGGRIRGRLHHVVDLGVGDARPGRNRRHLGSVVERRRQLRRGTRSRSSRPRAGAVVSNPATPPPYAQDHAVQFGG